MGAMTRNSEAISSEIVPIHCSVAGAERKAAGGVESSRPTLGVSDMTKKPPISKDADKQADILHPGMMGDGTEEQNLGERGNPAARIKKDEVDAAFGKQSVKK
jgi:hypothetical protein